LFENYPEKFYQKKHLFIDKNISKRTDFLIQIVCEKIDKISDLELAALMPEHIHDFATTRQFKKVKPYVKKYEKFFEKDELKEFYNYLSRYIAKGGSVDNVIL
jgi:hypothetical protein